MKTKSFTFPLVVSLLVVSNSFASTDKHPSAAAKGGANGGGGVALKCGEIHLADIGKAKTLFPWRFQCLTLDEARSAFLKALEEYNPEDYRQIKDALDPGVLQFKHTSDELPKLDTGVKAPILDQVLFGCEDRLLAYQDFGTHSPRIATIYDPLYKRLPIIEQALLEIHEAYVYLASLHSKDPKKDLPKIEAFAMKRTKKFYYHAKIVQPLVSAHYHNDSPIVLGFTGAEEIVPACAVSYDPNYDFGTLISSIYVQCVGNKLAERNFGWEGRLFIGNTTVGDDLGAVAGTILSGCVTDQDADLKRRIEPTN